MDNILKYLEESAWYKGRSIDVSFVNDDLKQAGLFLMNDTVSNFLKEFLYVELNLPYGYHLRFSIDDAIRFVDAKMLDTLREITKDFLVPIGIFHDGVALLFMSYGGIFYMLYNNEVTFLGNNLQTLMNYLKPAS